MISPRLLSLKFKGDRDYLHGTDFYEAIVGAAEVERSLSESRVRLSIHKLARRQVALLWSDGEPPTARPAQAVAEFDLRGGAPGGTTSSAGWLIETTTPVGQRYAYDEERAVAPCMIEGNRISFDQASPYRPIEIVVAMTKRLHYTVMPISGGRWMFTRLELARRLREDDTSALSIRLVNRLGHRLTKCEILSSDTRIGDIYFSVVKP